MECPFVHFGPDFNLFYYPAQKYRLAKYLPESSAEGKHFTFFHKSILGGIVSTKIIIRFHFLLN